MSLDDPAGDGPEWGDVRTLRRLADHDQPRLQDAVEGAHRRVFDTPPLAGRRRRRVGWPAVVITAAALTGAGAATAALIGGPEDFSSPAPDRDPTRSAAVLSAVQRELRTTRDPRLRASTTELVATIDGIDLFLIRSRSSLCLATASPGTPLGKTDGLGCSADPDPAKPLTTAVTRSATASIMADGTTAITATTSTGPPATITRYGNVAVAQAPGNGQIDVIHWAHGGNTYELDLARLRAAEKKMLGRALRAAGKASR